MERNAYFDNVKFILILLVVLGHVILLLPFQAIPLLKYLRMGIYTFHMPAFVFVSGFFAKYGNRHKAVYKYLLIYILSSLLFYPFHPQDNIFASIIVPYGILWYLISLVYWYVLLELVKIFPTPIVLALSLIAGLTVGYFNTHYIFAVSKTLYFFPFFLVGYYLNLDQVFKITKLIKPAILPGIMVAAGLYFMATFLGAENTIFYTSYPYVGAWNACFVNLSLYGLNTIAILCFLTLVTPARKSWTYLGGYTLLIYLGHGFIICLLRAFWLG